MGRALRVDVGEQVYHVLNRANARTTIFRKGRDYQAFEEILEEAIIRFSMRVLSYLVMPNHWHFVLYPRRNGDLAAFMGWLTLTHTQRWHAHFHSVGTGHLYQGRYKSFLVQQDEYLLQLCRYVESNASRAKLVDRAEDWRWSSLWRRLNGTSDQREALSQWPINEPNGYLEWVNASQKENELRNIRTAISKGRPLGDESWVGKMVKEFGLEITLRQPGRPKNGS